MLPETSGNGLKPNKSTLVRCLFLCVWLQIINIVHL